MYRDHTKVIKIGNRVIGGGNPILIQSMTNTKTEDVEATVAQILSLEKAGCDIIRCAVPTMEAAKALSQIKKQIHIPLVADIHFDYRLAIAAMENGADKIRINPGNIGSKERIQAVVDTAKERNIPIRVGVNSGSLEKELVEKYHGVTAEGLVESALDKVHIIEEMGYDNLVISIKSSDVLMCARAHELIADHTKVIKIGNRVIGGGNPILIQSMTNTKTEDVEATVAQILSLEKAGCDIIRCAVPTMEAAKALSQIKKQIHIPLVADIHFDYRLAIAAMENGADKIRINPGNIGSKERIQAVVDTAKERNIPIRVGVNSGSLEKELVEKYHGVTAEGLVESALDKVHIIEEMGYDNLVISIKSSDVLMCARAHELIAEKTQYPLHVGITEAGTLYSGNIKSAIGLGIILYQGIGDTIRVSLTGAPLEEVKSAKRILKTLGLRKGGVEVVSCPTCGRTKIDLIGLANQVETMVQDIPLDIKVAVMGCVVNGPGEAKEADLGIAGGDGVGLLIRHGEVVKKVPETDLLDTLRQELLTWNEQES